MPDIDTSWYVGRTQPLRERWAAENCLRQGAETYLPLYTERDVIVKGRLVPSRLRPLFPGYLFIRTLTRQWRFLRGTFGLTSIIMSGDNPATLTANVIDDIKEREAEGSVRLPDTPRMFATDDTVRVSEGPFAGKVGLVAGYTDAERVRVLLELLGRKVPCLFAEGQLEIAA